MLILYFNIRILRILLVTMFGNVVLPLLEDFPVFLLYISFETCHISRGYSFTLGWKG